MPSIVETLGNYTVTIDVQPPGDVHLIWRNTEGRELKRQPTGLRNTHPGEIDRLKDKTGSIRKTLRAQTHRIESFYLNDESLVYDKWREQYLGHPLLKVIVGGLVWLFSSDRCVITAMPRDGTMVNARGQVIDHICGTSRVRLWHPLHSGINECDAWRNYVWQHSVRQPFRQAYREVYPADSFNDVLRTVSGLYVRQHIFRALLLERGWHYSFRGDFESESVPSFSAPGDLRCEIGIRDQSRIMTNNGIAVAVALSDITFFHNYKEIAPDTIPAVLLSEIMRDIDMFTSRAGIGHEQDWNDIEQLIRTHRNDRYSELLTKYRQLNELLVGNDAASEPLADIIISIAAKMQAESETQPPLVTTRMRATILDTLLKNTKAGRYTRIDGHYAHVDTSDGRSYRINLASGLLLDNDRNKPCASPLPGSRSLTVTLLEDDLLTRQIYETIQAIVSN